MSFNFAEPPTLEVVPAQGCKGPNCGCTDGVSHSPECVAEHESQCEGSRTGRMESGVPSMSNIPKRDVVIESGRSYGKATARGAIMAALAMAAVSNVTMPTPRSGTLVRNRVTGNSKAGRKLRAQNSTPNLVRYRPEVPPEVAAWNAEVDAKKAAKAELKRTTKHLKEQA